MKRLEYEELQRLVAKGQPDDPRLKQLIAILARNQTSHHRPNVADEFLSCIGFEE